MNAASPTRITAYYYIDGRGEVRGPFSIDEMKGFAAERRLRRGMLVAREGAQDWKEAELFPDLAIAMPAPAPATIFFSNLPPPDPKPKWWEREILPKGVGTMLAVCMVTLWVFYRTPVKEPVKSAPARSEWIDLGYKAGAVLGGVDARSGRGIPTAVEFKNRMHREAVSLGIPSSETEDFEAGLRRGYEAEYKRLTKRAF